MKETVLVVEDDPDVRDVIARCLASRFTVKTAPDGRTALEFLSKEAFDLVVTDLVMPIMSGTELVSHCARSLPWMPVLVLTASNDVETAVESMKLGAWDYVLKPTKAGPLVAKLEKALERARSSFDVSRAVAECVAGRRPNLRGTRFGRYTLQEPIALGSYALVVRAEDERGTEVAMKLLRPDVEREPEALERFKLEAAVTGNLRHPNIVSMFEFGQIGETYFIAMEYVDGPALIDVISERGALGEIFALNVCCQIAEALVELEARGVVHRDIKPDNVLLGKDGTAKLADLGIVALARATRRLTQQGWTVGTIEYMAPEQIEDAMVDVRADIYGLGATIYHALCGRPPFEDRDERLLIRKRLTLETPPVSMVRRDLSLETVRLLARMLRQRKEERHQGAQELLQACRWALMAASKGTT